MGIRTKILTIEQVLDGMIDAEINEQILELLDDIRILSDAKDDVIKQLGGNTDGTSENSLHKHFVNARTLCFASCATLAKAMPLDQAIQIIKSDITGLPKTAVIDGELVVQYVR